MTLEEAELYLFAVAAKAFVDEQGIRPDMPLRGVHWDGVTAAFDVVGRGWSAKENRWLGVDARVYVERLDDTSGTLRCSWEVAQ